MSENIDDEKKKIIALNNIFFFFLLRRREVERNRLNVHHKIGGIEFNIAAAEVKKSSDAK